MEKMKIKTLITKSSCWSGSARHKTFTKPLNSILFDLSKKLPSLFFASEKKVIEKFKKEHPQIKEVIIVLTDGDYITYLEQKFVFDRFELKYDGGFNHIK